MQVAFRLRVASHYAAISCSLCWRASLHRAWLRNRHTCSGSIPQRLVQARLTARRQRGAEVAEVHQYSAGWAKITCGLTQHPFDSRPPMPTSSRVQMLVRSAVLFAAVGCLFGACCSSATAQEAWRETFEGPNVSWQPAGADLEYRLDIHRRIQGTAHSGNGCEQIQVTGSNGSAIYFSHAAPAARIFSELACALLGSRRSAGNPTSGPGRAAAHHRPAQRTSGDGFVDGSHVFSSRNLAAIAAGGFSGAVGATGASLAFAIWIRRRRFARGLRRSGLVECLRRSRLDDCVHR